MIDLDKYILAGNLLGLYPGILESAIADVLGVPNHFEPQRKSFPAYYLYGYLEFRSRDRVITYIGLSLGGVNPDLLSIKFGDTTQILHGDIIDYLNDHRVHFSIDTLMTDIDQTVLITDNSVHLAFNEFSILTKIVAVGS